MLKISWRKEEEKGVLAETKLRLLMKKADRPMAAADASSRRVRLGRGFPSETFRSRRKTRKNTPPYTATRNRPDSRGESSRV